MFEIYTDGATSNNGYSNPKGGYAWVIVQDNILLSEGSSYVEEATNNICELKGLIDGCSAFLNKYPLEQVIVYSDSAYCINCYKQQWYKKWQLNGWINSQKKKVANKELWEKLIPFFEKDNFIFEKVKGHNGNKWNEYVDKLAVDAKDKKE